MSAQERDALTSSVDAAVFELRQLTEFEIAPDVTITPPSDGLENRTDEFVAFLAAAGGD